MTKFIYYKELSLEEGFAKLAIPRESRIIAGRECSSASGAPLFKALYHSGQKIKCWHCGIEADRWIMMQGKRELSSKPVLNLFATQISPPSKRRKYPIPQLVMMTRDHIIPKSFGGVDSVENLRPGCSDCNSMRGVTMSESDLEFMHANPHLVSAGRLKVALVRAPNVVRPKSLVERTLIT